MRRLLRGRTPPHASVFLSDAMWRKWFYLRTVRRAFDSEGPSVTQLLNPLAHVATAHPYSFRSSLAATIPAVRTSSGFLIKADSNVNTGTYVRAVQIHG